MDAMDIDTHPYHTLSDVPRPNPWITLAESRITALDKLVASRFRSTSDRHRFVRDFQDEQRVLELVLLDLRSRHNAFCSDISAVPDDVLAIIFEYIARADVPRAPIDREGRDTLLARAKEGIDRELQFPEWKPVLEGGSLGWIGLSHVCRRWRQVLLGQPRLWGECVGILPLGLEEMLRRAGGFQPITLHKVCSTIHRRHTDLWETVLRSPTLPSPTPGSNQMHPLLDASRVRAIHIAELRQDEDPLPFAFPWPEGLVPFDFPALEILDVMARGAKEDIQPFEAWSRGLRSVHAPQLHTVKFVNYFIPWRSSCLVNLSIRSVSLEHTSIYMSSSLFLETLRQARHTLKTLELECCLPIDLSDAPDDEIIDFTRLRELKVSSHALHSFLTRVTFPRSTRLSLELPGFNVTILRGFSTLFRMASERIDGVSSLNALVLRDSPSMRGTTLSIDLYDSAQSIISSTLNAGATHTHTDPFASSTPRLTLGIRFPAYQYPEQPERVFHGLREYLDFARFPALSLRLCADEWTGDARRAAVAMFPRLSLLHVVNPLVSTHAAAEFPYILPVDGQQEDEERKALDTLWLVQRDAKLGTSYHSWCDALARQLRRAMPVEVRVSGTRFAPQAPKRMRVDYLPVVPSMARSKAVGIVRGIEEVVPSVEWSVAA
ncbi:unnamed protein product [Peniophora sp. CBMAI 1063]|nr:unnamed protein product [Peniophora sp. CBMAI 1063]